MNKKIGFFQSIHFKISIVFILLLLATIEIIGAYFTQQLQKENMESFKTSLQVKSYTNTQLADQLSKTDTKAANAEIANIISDMSNSQNTEVQVIDNKETIRAISNYSLRDLIGQRSTDPDIRLSDNSKSLYKTKVINGENYYIQVVPITSSTGDNSGNVGLIYIKASMNSVYSSIRNVMVIFLTASLVASVLGAIIALFIARAVTMPIDEMKKQAIRIANGDYSGQVKVYGQDELGQLAQAVNNLSIRVEEAQEASDSERRRLDNVLAHMTDGVIATDRHGKITIINETAMQLFDCKQEEVIGQSVMVLLNVEPEDNIQKFLEKRTEMFVALNEGTDQEVILHANFSLIQRITGFVSGMVCVFHDVTEQQQNEQEQRQFVSNVSHELRTPLTSVRSYIEALNDGAWQDPDIAPEFLKVTQEETDRMIRMINDLLNLSRMDQGTSKMNFEWVNLNEFVSYVLNRFDMMIKNNQEDQQKRKDYTIKRELGSHDLWAEIDTDKMTQVIDNIVNNAINYSPDGGVITVRLVKAANRVIISISDQGLGIPRKDINKIFDRFYRVDKARSRHQGGTGLGLAISKEVVESHKGRIWVESTEGRGSTFYISLPFEPLNEGEPWDAV
ncbi:cell wall metabolism sensor histidine kinase WalK [Holzapfeliella sp. JNUCC 80]